MGRHALLSASALRGAWRARYAREATPWHGPVDFAVAEPFLTKLSPGARVLEIGAGGGKTQRALASRGLDVTGLDWVREGLTREGGKSVMGDATRLPAATASFHAVTAFHVLESLAPAQRAAFLEEARRVLAPGGFLALRVFLAGDAREGAGAPSPDEAGTFVREGIPCHYFTLDEVRALLSGWEVGVLAAQRKPARWDATGRHWATGIFF